MTQQQAEGFYAVHRERPFFPGLTEFMSSGTMCGDGARKRRRCQSVARSDGRNGSGKADPGTLRKEFGGSVGENAVHGSDSDENAAIEIAYFFSRLELV